MLFRALIVSLGYLCRDVDLLSKQNASTYKNNSKNSTLTDITSCFFFLISCFILGLLFP